MRMSDLFADFQRKCPNLVKEMKAANHHFDEQSLNKYHLESDVFVHTAQVCLLTEIFNTSDIVKITSLLHDVGKPLARGVFPEEKKVKFLGHEGMSVFRCIPYLKTLGLSHQDMERVLTLISLHTILFRSVDPKKVIQKDIALRFVGNRQLLEDLIMVSKCDSMGRFYEIDPNESFPRENIEEFFAPTLAAIQPKEQRVTNKTLTVLVGPPISGKTTWVKKNRGDALVISRDDFLSQVAGTDNHNDAWKNVDHKQVDKVLEQAKVEAFKSGRDLIFDLTNLSVKARRRLWSRVPKNYKTKAIVFYVSYEELLKRNEIRTVSENKTIEPHRLLELLGGFTAPLLNEFDEIESIID
jgi:predicted kinase